MITEREQILAAIKKVEEYIDQLDGTPIPELDEEANEIIGGIGCVLAVTDAAQHMDALRYCLNAIFALGVQKARERVDVKVWDI